MNIPPPTGPRPVARLARRAVPFLERVLAYCESLTDPTPVAAEVAPGLRCVFSVDFAPGELDDVYARARGAGLTASQYIRSRALAPDHG